MQPVLLPVLGANMSEGVIRAWFKREGDAVSVGEPLFEVETDKANVEVEAEASGVLRCIVAAQGVRVPVLGLVAFLGEADEPIPDRETWESLVARSFICEPNALILSASKQERSSPSSVQVLGGQTSARVRVAASPAARRLAKERGISLDRIKGTGAHGEVTRADVEAASAQTVGTGRLDDGFIEEVRHGLDAFRALSSETKIDLYRRHGARIGEAVRIESGAVILAREIDIGAAATIGSDSTIECERVRLGRLAAFGKRTRVHCRSVQIGDALWSKDNVVIGGGGSAEADAHLEIGDAAFIGEGAYLNVGRRITLGDEVCVGSRAMLFTHSHWQSILRGYSSLFAPIVVGDHVFIGNGAFIFPGVTIGSGSTVMVNSFVAANVAANVMVGGVPAQVIRHLKLPSRSEQVEIFRARLTDLVRVLEERGYLVKAAENDDGIVFQIDGDALIRFTNSAEWSNTGSDGRRLILLAFPAAPRDSAPPGVTLFDLTASRVAGLQDPLSDEVREFCRRRGIRFRPFAWRYRVGHFEGDRFIPR